MAPARDRAAVEADDGAGPRVEQRHHDHPGEDLAAPIAEHAQGDELVARLAPGSDGVDDERAVGVAGMHGAQHLGHQEPAALQVALRPRRARRAPPRSAQRRRRGASRGRRPRPPRSPATAPGTLSDPLFPSRRSGSSRKKRVRSSTPTDRGHRRTRALPSSSGRRSRRRRTCRSRRRPRSTSRGCALGRRRRRDWCRRGRDSGRCRSCRSVSARRRSSGPALRGQRCA